jgi:hypothetical protein
MSQTARLCGCGRVERLGIDGTHGQLLSVFLARVELMVSAKCRHVGITIGYSVREATKEDGVGVGSGCGRTVPSSLADSSGWTRRLPRLAPAYYFAKLISGTSCPIFPSFPFS